MKEEMENKFRFFVEEILTSKSASTITNPRSDTSEIKKTQPPGLKSSWSIGLVDASNKDNSHTDPLQTILLKPLNSRT